MRRGGSSAKGSTYERLLARLLGQWWYGDPDVLVRAAGSGSVLTKRAGSGLTICGEYVQVKYLDDPFPFAVEAKHRKVMLDLPCMLKLPKHYFWEAWSQCQGAATNARLVPLLIWRTNRRADLVVMPQAAPESNVWRVQIDTPEWYHLKIALLTEFLADTELRDAMRSDNVQQQATRTGSG